MGRFTAILLFLAFAGPAAADEIARSTIAFEGRERTYYLEVPASAQSGPAPLVVLLHGSGGNGLFMAQQWKDLAEREGIVLLAPDSLHTDAGWDLRYDGPGYIHALIATVAASHPVDFKRLYVFGQSGGAVYTLTLAMLESEYFAAAAFHAGGWRRAAEYRVCDYATRKIPISMWVGDRDEYFSLPSVRTTERVLVEAGFPAELNILDGRRHSYLDVPADFHDRVWKFLSSHALDGPAKYAQYR
jgi:poly(3-hydroxybutyrate) depolymerase